MDGKYSRRAVLALASVGVLGGCTSAFTDDDDEVQEYEDCPKSHPALGSYLCQFVETDNPKALAEKVGATYKNGYLYMTIELYADAGEDAMDAVIHRYDIKNAEKFPPDKEVKQPIIRAFVRIEHIVAIGNDDRTLLLNPIRTGEMNASNPLIFS